MGTLNRDLIEVTARELQPGDRDGQLMRGRKIVEVRPIDRGRVELVMEWGNGRRDKPARVEAGRKFRVSRVIAGPGMALRHRAKARTTGGIVEVWDTHHDDSPVKPEQVKGHRWAMRCEHDTAIGRRTQDQAVDDVRDPRLWCVRCTEPSFGAAMLPL